VLAGFVDDVAFEIGVELSGMPVLGTAGEVAQLGPGEVGLELLLIGDDIQILVLGDMFCSTWPLGPEVQRRILSMIPPLLLKEDSPVRAELVDSYVRVLDSRRPILARRSREGDLVREAVRAGRIGAPDERVGESPDETDTL
jgi:hypothetical protein